ncbi:PspC domain-containing protein [Wenyingzhuangia sp. 2_MG-2023]|uniref:PspC domain-containing protein n=1 Tax=Wenyingzhuangia sp. 2_MG-2023 TaxID=3062639 RepID=UPI0026E418C7|nr:PspC domain-containing protein [Wenyingzhuangia sp. 2_MG-2023]MDO6738264.1 PspC domain-containing protein [Wenyingzhuangia sp. 2_MG-2023]MDO6802252.1 PspC domain-containing protein [Wenyingzhuangia sp. 1_MG-2023]
MNKTININLGGFFFHIDESAYQILKRYLEAISNSLSDDPQGKDEILADIEARISELLSEKIQDKRQVVNEQDIQSIIKIMGEPEDYADTEDAYTEHNSSYRTKGNPVKKLFRDGEDKFLGGVASGIAHYFNTDPIWIRIALILLLAAGGFGVYTYIILWILLPEAKTTAEKLQMQGEHVNINNIEKKIRTEFENVSNKIKNTDYSGAKIGFQAFLDNVGIILIRLFKICTKIIGVFLIIISSILMVSLVLSAFSFSSLEMLGINHDLRESLPFLYQSSIPSWLLSIAMLISFVIPCLLLFFLGINIVSSKTKPLNKIAFTSLFILWICAILSLVFSGLENYSLNAVEGSKVKTDTIEMLPSDTLYVKTMNNDNFIFKSQLMRNSNQEIISDNNVQKIYSSNIYINIKKSESDEPYLKIRKKSEGNSLTSALENAEKISYGYQFTDNQVMFDSYFLSPMDSKFKDEMVSVDLYLPEGMTLVLNESSKNFIHNYKTTKRLKFWQLINHHFTMTQKGLNCTDCELDQHENI